MTDANHPIVRDFFSAMNAGNLPDTLFTADMMVWTTTSGAMPKARYQGGVKLLQSLFDGGLTYTIDSLTAQDDRVAAEVRSSGKLVNGQEFANTYVFMFRICDGRIAAVAEHFNPDCMREKIEPLMRAALSKAVR